MEENIPLRILIFLICVFAQAVFISDKELTIWDKVFYCFSASYMSYYALKSLFEF